MLKRDGYNFTFTLQNVKLYPSLFNMPTSTDTEQR